MPLYEYECKNCQRKVDRFVPLAQYNTAQLCSTCGFLLVKCLSAPQIQVDILGYSCPITGKWIGSRREHRENLERHNCRVLEPGESTSCTKSAADKERAFEQEVEQTVIEFVTQMPESKRQDLIREAQTSPDFEIVRK